MKKVSLLAILPLLTACIPGAEDAVVRTTLDGKGIGQNQVMKVQAIEWKTDEGKNVNRVESNGEIIVTGDIEKRFIKPKIQDDNTYLSVAGPVVYGNEDVFTSDYYLKLNGDRPVKGDMKLTYTDFGYIYEKVNLINGQTEYKGKTLPIEQGDSIIWGGADSLLAGGHRNPEDYQKTLKDLGAETTFTGRAMGYAQYGKEEESGAPKTIFLDGTATLVAGETKPAKLEMEFDNLGNIKYNDENNTIVYEKPAAVAEEFNEEAYNALKSNANSDLKFEVGYYGVKEDSEHTGANPNVIEAVGSLQAGKDNYKLRLSYGAVN